MSTETIWRTHSTDSATTEKIAETIGQNLRGGETIELVSDLGGGKTTFVRGLARGAGSNNHVSSPSFKISNIYQASDFEIAHFDFYRLQDPGLIAFELLEAQRDPKTVVVVEWGQIVEDVLSKTKLAVTIKTDGKSGREIECSFPDDLAYMLKGLNP